MTWESLSGLLKACLDFFKFLDMKRKDVMYDDDDENEHAG